MNVSGRSALRLVLAGLFLSGLPSASLARHNFFSKNSTRITLPATLSIIGDSITASTALNTLDLNQLAGTDNMAVGDIIYVHLNIKVDKTNETPKQINYPFAISKNRPQRLDDDTVSLRGVVTSRDDTKIDVHYLFENLMPEKKLLKALSLREETQGEIQLDINNRAVGHIKAISFDGEEIDYD